MTIADEQQRSVDELSRLILLKQGQRGDIERQIQLLNEEAAQKTGEYESVYAELTQARTDISKIRNEMDEIKMSIALLVDEKNGLQKEISTLIEQKEKYDILTNEIEGLLDRAESIRKSIISLSESENLARTSLDIIEREIRIKNTKLEEVTHQYNTLKDEVEYYLPQKDEVAKNLIEITRKEEIIKELTERNEKAVERLTQYPETIGYYISGLQRHMDTHNIKVSIVEALNLI